MNEAAHRSLLKTVAQAVTKLPVRPKDKIPKKPKSEFDPSVTGNIKFPDFNPHEKKEAQKAFPLKYRGYTIEVHRDAGGGHLGHAYKKHIIKYVTKRHPNAMRAVGDTKNWINENAPAVSRQEYSETHAEPQSHGDEGEDYGPLPKKGRTLLMPNASQEAKTRDIEQSDREYRQDLKQKGKKPKGWLDYTVGDFLKRKKAQSEDYQKALDILTQWSKESGIGIKTLALVYFGFEDVPQAVEKILAYKESTGTFPTSINQMNYMDEVALRFHKGQSILPNPEDTTVVDADKTTENLRQQSIDLQQRVLDVQTKAQSYVDALANKAAKSAKLPTGGGLVGLQQEALRIQSELNEKLKALPQNFIQFSDGVTIAKVQTTRLNDPAWSQMIDAARTRGQGVMKRVTQILDRLSVLFQKLTVDIQLKEFDPGEFTDEVQQGITDKNVDNVDKINQYQQRAKEQAPMAQKYFLDQAGGRVQTPGFKGGQRGINNSLGESNTLFNTHQDILEPGVYVVDAETGEVLDGPYEAERDINLNNFSPETSTDIVRVRRGQRQDFRINNRGEFAHATDLAKKMLRNSPYANALTEIDELKYEYLNSGWEFDPVDAEDDLNALMRRYSRKIISQDEMMSDNDVKQEIYKALDVMIRHVNEWAVRDTARYFSSWGFWKKGEMAIVDENTARDILLELKKYARWAPTMDLDQIHAKTSHYLPHVGRKIISQDTYQMEFDFIQEMVESLQDSLNDIMYVNSDLQKNLQDIQQLTKQDSAYPLPNSNQATPIAASKFSVANPGGLHKVRRAKKVSFSKYELEDKNDI